MKLVKNIDQFRDLTNEEVDNILLLECTPVEISIMSESKKFTLYRDISQEIIDMKH